MINISRDALSSLSAIKSHLGLESTQTKEDDLICNLINAETRLIENYCRRKFRYRTYTNEQYDGPGPGAILMLRNYPIKSISEVTHGIDPYYTGDVITSADYRIDYENGVIKSFVGWSSGARTIQITYNAGYGFTVVDGENDVIDFKEASGGSELHASISAGTYTAAGLATATKTALDAAGSATYTVTYNYQTGKFTIASGGSFLSLLWYSGTYSSLNASMLLGYNNGQDDTTLTSYVGDQGVVGLPEDLELACIIGVLYRRQRILDRRFGVMNINTPGGGSISVSQAGLLPEQIELLAPYCKMDFGGGTI